MQQEGKYHLYLKNKKKKLLEREREKIILLVVAITYKFRTIPLACCINSRSASRHNDFELSPVQSRQWDNSQSASAHDLLQILATLSQLINSYLMPKKKYYQLHIFQWNSKMKLTQNSFIWWKLGLLNFILFLHN